MATPKKKPAETVKKPAAAKTAAKPAAAKKTTTAAAKTSAKPAAPKKTAAAKPAAKPATDKKAAPAKTAGDKKVTPAKPAAKATTPQKPTPAKPAAKATTPQKPASAKPAAKATTPQKPAPAKPATKPTPAPTPSTTKKATGDAKAKKPSKPKDSLTAEEKARVKKLREQLAVLKADKEWPAFLKEQQAALLSLRNELVPNMQNVTRDHLRSGASNVSSSSGQHIGDAGSEAEVRDLTIRLLDKDREQLREIDDALERIRKGVYGICEISLELIPKRRLQVRPFCRLTVKCQEEYEKKYGSYANYRARQSDQVGYANLQNDMENAISLDEDEE